MRPSNIRDFVCNQATQKHTAGAFKRLRNVDYGELARKAESRVSDAIKIRDDHEMDHTNSHSTLQRHLSTEKFAGNGQTLSRNTSYK